MKLNLLLLPAAALFNAATATADPPSTSPPTSPPTSLPTSAIETVNLGDAGKFVILAKTGISTVPKSAITGDIAVSPIVATAITGFALVLIPAGQYSTSNQVVGNVYAGDYTSPTPSELTDAVGDMEIAYNDAAASSNADGVIRMNVGDGGIGGLTLYAGVYTFTTDINIAYGTELTFHGSSTDVFILQTSKNLVQYLSTNVVLAGGAKAENIFWQVAGLVVVGAGAHLEGILLVKTGVTFITGSSLNGRILAQTACVLQMATITEPTSE
jgi:hypothetical protein